MLIGVVVTEVVRARFGREVVAATREASPGSLDELDET